jgi:putative transposase
MFRNFLEYKCLDHRIKVEIIEPQYTSKDCSRCGSSDTQRPSQSSFKCGSCNFNLHADLNAARNIRMRYTSSNGLPVDLTSISGLTSG